MTHAYLTEDRVADVCPFLIVADRSGSMRGSGIENLNREVPRLIRALRADWEAAELARIGMLTFNERATETFAITDPAHLSDNDLALAPSGRTAFGEAFTLARTMIDRDLPELGVTTYRPVLFVLSDGNPTDPERWPAALRRLTDPNWNLHPNVVTFPFGNADMDALRSMASRPELCIREYHNMEPGEAVRRILDVVLHSVVDVTQSVVDKGNVGDLRSKVARMLFEDSTYQRIIYTR
jgi:uncharacterized protein YegL